MGQKVTFYNEISIQKPVGDIKVPGNSSSLSSNGIYFSPANDILQNQPPHIVQGQYIYTLGSRIINNTEEDLKSIVSNRIDENNKIIFTHNDDSYFVSKIESNEFDKTITVTKSTIDLSGITTPLKNIFDGLKSTDSSVRIDETTIRLYWDAEKGLQLSDSKLQPNNIHIVRIYDSYDSNSYLTDTTGNIISIFAYTDLTVTIPKAYNDYLKVENITALEGFKSGKVIKLLKPWSDNYNKNSYTFSGFNITAIESDPYASATQNNYSFELKKSQSPFEFNKSNINFDVSNSPFSLSDVTTDVKGEVNYTQQSLYNINSSYCTVSDTNKNISVTNAYYISNDAYVMINVTDNTQEYDIYYKTTKPGKVKLLGAKQWELSFDCNGGPASYNVKKNAYYNKAFTFPANPTREGYIFNGWFKTKTGGTEVKSINAGASGYTWTNYSTTLYAQWTQSVKYYWYVGTENPASMTPPSVGNADTKLCAWTLLTTKPTEIPVYKTDENWNEYRWYIAIPEEYGYNIYDNANNNITSQFTKTSGTIAGVKYAIYQTMNLMDTIDVKVK